MLHYMYSYLQDPIGNPPTYTNNIKEEVLLKTRTQGQSQNHLEHPKVRNYQTKSIWNI